MLSSRQFYAWLVLTPVITGAVTGVVAVVAAFGNDLWSGQLQRVSALLHRPAVSRAALGALAVAMLLYAGETVAVDLKRGKSRRFVWNAESKRLA